MRRGWIHLIAIDCGQTLLERLPISLLLSAWGYCLAQLEFQNAENPIPQIHILQLALQLLLQFPAVDGSF